MLSFHSRSFVLVPLAVLSPVISNHCFVWLLSCCLQLGSDEFTLNEISICLCRWIHLRDICRLCAGITLRPGSFISTFHILYSDWNQSSYYIKCQLFFNLMFVLHLFSSEPPISTTEGKTKTLFLLFFPPWTAQRASQNYKQLLEDLHTTGGPQEHLNFYTNNLKTFDL